MTAQQRGEACLERACKAGDEKSCRLARQKGVNFSQELYYDGDNPFVYQCSKAKLGLCPVDRQWSQGMIKQKLYEQTNNHDIL